MWFNTLRDQNWTRDLSILHITRPSDLDWDCEWQLIILLKNTFLVISDKIIFHIYASFKINSEWIQMWTQKSTGFNRLLKLNMQNEQIKCWMTASYEFTNYMCSLVDFTSELLDEGLTCSLFWTGSQWVAMSRWWGYSRGPSWAPSSGVCPMWEGHLNANACCGVLINSPPLDSKQ